MEVNDVVPTVKIDIILYYKKYLQQQQFSKYSISLFNLSRATPYGIR